MALNMRLAVPALLGRQTPRLATRPRQLQRGIKIESGIASSIRNVPSAFSRKLVDPDDVVLPRRFEKMSLDGKVVIATGGAQGLGLSGCEAAVEAGAHVYALDRQREPSEKFYEAQKYYPKYFGGSLNYERVDVLNAKEMHDVFAHIAAKHKRLDGVFAAAAVQRVQPFLEYPAEEVTKMMDINFRGVFLAYQAGARQMVEYKTPGSLLAIASMSGSIANKGLNCSVYNSSKAAVVQLTRNVAMEMSPIRCNTISPGTIITPMVEKNFKEQPGLQALWEKENMLGRISTPDEYKMQIVLLLSGGSSFATGSNIIIDGGYTAW